MTLGEKLRFLRTKEKITQEALAEKLSVSRSAIAKWETNNGTPDISNLKRISQMFAISMDSLLNDADKIDADSLNDVKSDSRFSEYMGYYYNIELKGWNDGVFDVLIIGEDKDFIFYQKKGKDHNLYGLLGKKYITSINRNSKCNASSKCPEFEGRNYFCARHVFIELAIKEGGIKGFFDFCNDDYLDVYIHSFTDTTVYLKFGGEINTDLISKIEELDI
ncbi:MAG: helix-turn-helix transcriptional regulator [Lachnospiraceae bacterium]|nr:helix-turn-helix transcriptional regulator [Lachnospiraceae bacterium]